jgi:hypothetical protein
VSTGGTLRTVTVPAEVRTSHLPSKSRKIDVSDIPLTEKIKDDIYRK